MKKILIPAMGALAVFLASCNQGSEDSGDGTRTGSGGSAPPPPSPPSAEVVAALEAQPLGKKLLGQTLALSGTQLVKADLAIAPEFYFVYYSASW